MILDPPLIPVTLICRYKRFLADVSFPDGTQMTVHTPNTGSMKGCAEPGMRIWIRDTKNPNRKYRYSWDITETATGVLVGVHTGFANTLVVEAIKNSMFPEITGVHEIRQEVAYGKEKSRIDIYLELDSGRQCFVEVKNVTALREKGVVIFPDAVTERGKKHLRELIEVIKQGQRGILVFCIQREDAEVFSPADEIDPGYGAELRDAVQQGLEIYAIKATVAPDSINLTKRVDIKL